MRRFLTSILVWLLCSLPVIAQNNPQQLPDDLYSLYKRAEAHVKSDLGLRIADTLMQEGLIRDNGKAQVLALTIPVRHYFRKRNLEQLDVAIDRIKAKARETNLLQYYYFGWNQKVICLLNMGRTFDALKENMQIQEQAQLDEHPYGIFTCLRNMAYIYQVRGNARLAFESYKQALDYMLKHMTDQDPAPLYQELASYYLKSEHNPLKALEYADKAIETSLLDTSRAKALYGKCIILFELNRKEDFLAVYEKAEAFRRKNPALDISFYYRWAHLRRQILLRDFEGAMKTAEDMFDDDRQDALILVNEHLGNFRAAYNALKKRVRYKDSLNQNVQSSDIAALNATIGNMQLMLEKERLDKENADLSANTAYQHTVILSLVAGILALFVIGLTWGLYHHRKFIGRLNTKNQELALAHEKAETANRMKTLFIQNMSHEIRTPLNSIVGFAQVISDSQARLEDEDRQQFCELIEHNTHLLLNLVDDILMISDLDSGNYEMKQSPCPINALCQDILATFGCNARKEVMIHYETDAPDDYWFTTDGNRLSQVLLHLLGNALKYTAEGRITLACSISQKPGFVVLSVADTGTGIPEEARQRIFERFGKADDFKQGIGLGLSLCRAITEKLGGTIGLDESYTGGARFVITMPA